MSSRIHPRAASVVAAAVALLLAAGAAAQSVAPAVSDDPDSEVARNHFDRGSELYSQLNYEQAIVEFKAANLAKPHPDFDYNIARCYDRLGDWPHALDYYRRYLSAMPGSDDVRTRVEELEARVARMIVPTPTPTPAPVVVVPPPQPWRLRIAALTVGAVGVAALAGAGGFYGSVEADLPSRRAYCRSLPRNCVSSEWADLTARYDASQALWIVGGALLAVDVVLWAIDVKHRRDWRRAVTAAGALTASRPALDWSVHF